MLLMSHFFQTSKKKLHKTILFDVFESMLVHTICFVLANEQNEFGCVTALSLVRASGQRLIVTFIKT